MGRDEVGLNRHRRYSHSTGSIGALRSGLENGGLRKFDRLLTLDLRRSCTGERRKSKKRQTKIDESARHRRRDQPCEASGLGRFPVSIIKRIDRPALARATKDRDEKKAEQDRTDNSEIGDNRNWKAGRAHAPISRAKSVCVEEILYRQSIPKRALDSRVRLHLVEQKRIEQTTQISRICIAEGDQEDDNCSNKRNAENKETHLRRQRPIQNAQENLEIGDSEKDREPDIGCRGGREQQGRKSEKCQNRRETRPNAEEPKSAGKCKTAEGHACKGGCFGERSDDALESRNLGIVEQPIGAVSDKRQHIGRTGKISAQIDRGEYQIECGKSHCNGSKKLSCFKR